MSGKKNLVAAFASLTLLTLGCLALPGLATADDNAQSDDHLAQVGGADSDQAQKTTDRSEMDNVSDSAPVYPEVLPLPTPPQNHHVIIGHDGTVISSPHSDNQESQTTMTMSPQDTKTTPSKDNDSSNAKDYNMNLTFVIFGSIFVAGGAAMELSLLFEDDDDHRTALGISGGLAIAFGLVFLIPGAVGLHQAISNNHAFNVTPVMGPKFNGAVFNMTF